MQFREHNLRLARSLGRAASNNRNSSPADSGDKLKPPARSSSLARTLIESWQEDLYRDFDTVYRSLCEEHSAGLRPTATPAPGSDIWSREVQLEAAGLRESLSGVEAALRRASGTALSPQLAPSPMLSVTTSEQTRADSRNTNQSLQGPALVEEMTLSDLEEEICSTLMAAKESDRQKKYFSAANGLALEGERLARGRSRQPLPMSVCSLVGPSRRARGGGQGSSSER